MERHKQIEQRFYDDEAMGIMREPFRNELGSASYPPEQRGPYLEFERQVARVARPRDVVLDVAAGTGRFSFAAHGEGRFLIATDISHLALQIARQHAEAAGIPLCVVCADGERLPFRDAAIHVVTSAGALCCFDLNALSREVCRVLDPAGSWIAVDSLNDSPFYRLNRFIGVMRRRRTARVLHYVPTTATVRKLARDFRTVQVTFHGILAFLLPVLKPILGRERATAFVSAADRRLPWLQRWAFKFVVVAQQPC
jgi:SAM-dependent methyltransferase